MKVLLALAACACVLYPAHADAQPPLPTCTQLNGSSFSGTGAVRTLKTDCRTSVTITVPANMTLNGNGNTIVAFDPVGGFNGGVIRNETAGAVNVVVTNLIVDTENLTDASGCKAGNDRLRGILFDDASGKITNNTVVHINKGPSGCQEGNGIEVRDFSGSGINTVTVSGNKVYEYQKGGIIINGEVSATVSGNIVGQSATQANLAANGIQVGFGALATVSGNDVEGNTWLGWDPMFSDFAATAVLLFESAASTKVLNNRINLVGGNADVGIYVGADSVSVTTNRVYDFGPDVAGVNPDMDIGIANPGNLNSGLNNTFTKNRVRCYQQPYDNVTGASNVVLACTDPTSTSTLPLASGASLPARPASPSEP